MFPETVVWLKNITFEVDAKANNGTPFVCHIVVPYSKDLKDRLVSMDSKAYFNNCANLEREYKESIQIFKFDMVPGTNQVAKDIDIKSRTKAMGAYLFAKYGTPGRFMEVINSSPVALVRCLQNNIEVKSISDLNLFSSGKDKK